MIGPFRISCSLLPFVTRPVQFFAATAYQWPRLRKSSTGIVYCVGGLTLGWTIYKVSARQIETRLRQRFEERLAKRIRTVADLHDSLLQTIAASKMVVDDASDQPGDPAHVSRAMGQLSEWLQLAARDASAAAHSLAAVSLVEAAPLDHDAAENLTINTGSKLWI